MDKVRALLDHVAPLFPLGAVRRPMIRDVLRMGDPRLLQPSLPVEHFDTPELDALLADLRDTMAAQNGAGLAAPQIGVPLQVVIFGFEPTTSATPTPSPCRTPSSSIRCSRRCRAKWRRMGRLPVGPGLRGVVPRFAQLRYEGFDPAGRPHRARGDGIPRPRRPARMRSPAGHPLSDAHARLAQLRIHRHPVPRRAARRGVGRTRPLVRAAAGRRGRSRASAARARRAGARRR